MAFLLIFQKFECVGRVFVICKKNFKAMKKFLFLFLALSIVHVANAQNSDHLKLQVIGDFIVINKECITSTGNDFGNLSVVEKVILKKNLITSIVVQLNPPKRKNEERNWKKVIVTTSERISRFESGVDAKAMGNSFKTYEFLFQKSTSADSFAQEITKLSTVK